MKTTIDHTLRQKMGITCGEYIALEAIAGINRDVPFVEDEFHSAKKGLISKGYISYINGESPLFAVTEKALKFLKADNSSFVYDVISFLNKESNAKYKAYSKPTIQVVNARVADGFTYEDFVSVIKFKCKEWLHTDQEQYLRPITLFGNKFEGYLQAAIRAEPKAPENKNMEGMVM